MRGFILGDMPVTTKRTDTSLARGTADSRPAQRRTQAERSETTTEELLSVGRRLFATKGFPGTSIQEIVDEAGVTRGAMYHHFAGKDELFEAVFAREQKALGRRVREAAMRKKGVWRQLKAGCDEFLNAMLDPQTQRILMIDGPAVLGPAGVQERDECESVQLLTHVVEKAMAEGALRKRAVMPIVQLLYGALCQAAMVIARSEDQDETTRQMRQEVRRLLDALEDA